MITCRIVIDPHASDSSKQFVQTALDMYNVAVTGLDEYYPVAIFLKQDNEEIAGGLLGEIWGTWLHVTNLWVAVPLRRHGYGSQLLRAAEQYAIERGCQNVHLETFSFQARPLLMHLRPIDLLDTEEGTTAILRQLEAAATGAFA